VDERIPKLLAEYRTLAHAMQSGVQSTIDLNFERGIAGDTTPKHLRTGVNSAMVDSAALARLLMKKGVITEFEYYTSLVEVMREEVQRYEKDLSQAYGVKITLA